MGQNKDLVCYRKKQSFRQYEVSYPGLHLISKALYCYAYAYCIIRGQLIALFIVIITGNHYIRNNNTMYVQKGKDDQRAIIKIQKK